VSAPGGADTALLPERVQEALGELVGAAQEGLLALSVGVGLGVLHELVVLEQMLAGVSTRRFERTREPVGAEVETARLYVLARRPI